MASKAAKKELLTEFPPHIIAKQRLISYAIRVFDRNITRGKAMLFKQKTVFHLALLLAAVVTVNRTAHARDHHHAVLPTFDGGSHLLLHNVVERAFEFGGEKLVITRAPQTPPKRMELMLEQGKLTGAFLLRTAERDSKYIPIPVGLLDGMMGRRVLLVPKSHPDIFEGVKSIKELKNMEAVAGLGMGWFDCEVWSANGLEAYEVANTKLLYRLVGNTNRNVDYFPRGLPEILTELETYGQHVTLDPHLILEYEREMILYLSPKYAELRDVFHRCLTQAKETGLLKKILNDHLEETFELIKPENRTVIRLRTPS